MSDYFNPDERRERPSKIDRCAWESQGVRCQMPGTIGLNPQGTGPHYCTWHYDMGIGAPDMARYSDDLTAFVAWMEGHRKFYDFPEHARRAGCDWCKYTLSSLWAALTEGVTDPLTPDPVAVEFCRQAALGGGGGHDPNIAKDYMNLIRRTLNHEAPEWRTELNQLNAKYGMEDQNVAEREGVL